MTPRAWHAAAVIALLGGGGTACHHHAHAAAVAPAPSDSLVGIVSVVGTSFEQRVMLRSGDYASSLALSSADSAALSRVGAAEVVVRGVKGDVFRVSTFEVRRVDGAPVADGILARDGDRLALDTQRGRLALGNPPAALDSLVGARIWVSGPLDVGPNSYGIIVPR